MKKLLLVLAIGAFAACNDGGTAEAPKADSAAPATVDTPAAPATVDTTAAHADTTAHAAVDTTKK